MNSVAVLITCHNRREKTLICLESLFDAVLPADITMDIFLVDDGSNDDTSVYVKNRFPEVFIIRGNGNLFWNRGMYLAWETAINHAKFDYFLWLNDDTVIFENALYMMLDYSQKIDNKKIIIGATSSSSGTEVTYSGFSFPNKKLLPNNVWQDCDYFNGNLVLIPTFVYNKVGLLDKRYHHTLGDFDYGIRASKLGFVHSLSPQCLGTCDAHETDPDWCNHTVPLFKRLKHLYTPLGNNPFEFFVYDKRHNGLFKAFLHFFTIHLRAIFPFAWKRLNLVKSFISVY